MFNPFLNIKSGSGGGSGGTGDSYSIKRKIDFKGNLYYSLIKTNSDGSSSSGDQITFTISDLKFSDDKTLEQVLNLLIAEDAELNSALKAIQGQISNAVKMIDFDAVNIDTTGKTLNQIMSELSAKNIPENTIIHGTLFSEALPDDTELPLENAGVQILIVDGIDGGKYYKITATSEKSAPYSWEAIYKDDQMLLDWTPTYDNIRSDFNELKTQFIDHIGNTTIHTTQEEKQSWNEKVSTSIDDSSECLVFY